MGVDLIAAIYRGLTSYAAIAAANGDAKTAAAYLQKAAAYQQRIDADWWDEEAALYRTHYTNEKKFGKYEGETFLLWFDALKDSTRLRHTIEHILSMDLNVENLSYLPLQYYRNGYPDQAYALILRLANPSTQRREYPEVSYGLIEAVVQGLMGVDVNAITRTVSTLYRSAGPVRSQLIHLPVLNTTLTLTHFSPARSAVINTGTHPFKWRARFAGDFAKAFVDKDMPGGKTASSSGQPPVAGQTSRKLKKGTDRQGQVISWLELEVAPGEEISLKVK
jgi:hypothetical protein